MGLAKGLITLHETDDTCFRNLTDTKNQSLYQWELRRPIATSFKVRKSVDSRHDELLAVVVVVVVVAPWVLLL
jgi:hypothetical protein